MDEKAYRDFLRYLSARLPESRAEDAAHDILLRFLRYRQHHQVKNEPALLRTITRRHLYELRKDQPVSPSRTEAPQLYAVLLAEDLRWLRSAIADLHPRYRAVIERCWLEEQSDQECAIALGLSRKQVQQAKWRGLKALRSAYTGTKGGRI